MRLYYIPIMNRKKFEALPDDQKKQYVKIQIARREIPEGGEY